MNTETSRYTERQERMKTSRIWIRNCAVIGVLYARGVMAAAEAQTYRVPCRYSAELAADRQVLAEREAMLDS